MASQEQYKVALVPFPLTPLAAFGFFLYQQVGLIGEQTSVVYHWRPASQAALQVMGKDFILRLFGSNLHGQLSRVITDSTKGVDRYLLRRMLNFFQAPSGSCSLKNIRPLKKRLLSDWETPDSVLEKTTRFFRECLKQRLDPFNFPLLLSLLKVTETKKRVPQPSSWPLSQQFLLMPVFRTAQPAETDIIGLREIALSEGQIWQLAQSHLAIVVGGPAGSGKSTITTTLVDEMRRIVRSLQTRADWQEFKLNIEYVNLDLGTPVGDAIFEGVGQNREILQQRKRPWTPELAFTALKALCRTKQQANIVVADLTGRIDCLTEIIAAPADVGILITRDWEKMAEWQTFLARMGIVKLAQARTRLPEEGLESVIRRYDPSHIIAGRVTGLERVIRSWDPFIFALARVLLFDLLPTFVAKRQQKVERLLSSNP